MQYFIKIATLVLVGVSLQGCSDIKKLLHLSPSAFEACQEQVSNSTKCFQEKAIDELRDFCENSTTNHSCAFNWQANGPLCIKSHFKAMHEIHTKVCVPEILSHTNLSSLRKSQNETKVEAAAEADAEKWYAEHADAINRNLASNLSQLVEDCACNKHSASPINSSAVEEKFYIDQEKYMVDEEVTKKADWIAYISAAGVGMILAALAGAIRRRTSEASTFKLASAVGPESVLFSESDGAQ
eukprot:CAMPEP_0172658860 /NCGR_PEP_ID=MMETSP1074-20121228/3037_1 /TAXON_ID=2916 /ORGANISM="Ceratium fusus, Strain PA161109" /LENGTH=240 /DNA_ID=CAMNT_0013474217 /DNA_START=69 /DNA_END=791 /DNA_ORIENTATION=+